MAKSVPQTVHVVGLVGGEWFGESAGQALNDADLLVGSDRQHRQLPDDLPGERVRLFGPLDQIIDLIEQRRAVQRVTLLASGDPGFFGIARLLVGRFGPDAVRLHPAPTSVGLAFARIGLPWDDATVVSCHGRSLDDAVPRIVGAAKVACLTSASCPPEVLGQALLEAGAAHTAVWVCSRLGEPDESVTATTLSELAKGSHDGLSIVVAATQLVAPEATLQWGRPVSRFSHRNSMITKPEVRAVALSKLEVAGASVLWDVGAGSGSIAIEAARLAPGLRGYAIERNAEDCARIVRNAARVAVSVVHGQAPECFADLPQPDRVFVGGGGSPVVNAAYAHLRPGGIFVATFVQIGAALEAARLAGSMVQMSVQRAESIGGEKDLRLTAANPVFVVWGTK